MIRLALLDYRAALRERKTWLVVAMLVYAILAIPVLLERPPAHVREAIAAWFGDADPFAVFMFVWIDLVMNKVVAFIPVILASGVLLRERDTGVLAVLAAKPISMSRYFVMRTLSVCAVMLTLYAATQLAGALWFPGRVAGFRPGTFLAAMSLHAFAAVFATAFAATIIVAVGRRGPGVLVALMLLGLLVGLALVGFYQPAWYTATLANPLTLGASAMRDLAGLSAGTLIPPMLALLGLTAVTIAIGARLARRVEA
jgi:ABC-2 type transport system permease protein